MDIEKIWVTVPIGKRENYIPGLLSGLENFSDRIIFVNNSPGYTRFSNVHHIEDFGEINIYRWWNTGINYAYDNGAEYVAILNDDVVFDNLFISSICEFLIINKLAIVDVLNSGNGGGSAWIMDLSYNLRLDERFRWWYGDTELFDRARKMNKFGKFVYKGFNHISPNGNLTENKMLQSLVNQDKELFNNLSSDRNN